MVASVEQLKGLFSQKSGVARPNLFTLTGLPTINGVTGNELNLLCRDLTLPGRQILSYDKVIGNRREKVAYGGATDDVAMSFLLLNDYGARKYFEDWQRLAYDEETYQVKYKSEYTHQITINQLKKGISFPLYNRSLRASGLPTSIINRLPDIGPISLSQLEIDLDFITSANKIYSCFLEEAWPTTVESISLNNELDGLIELRVSFNYVKWRSEFYTVSQQSELTSLAIGSVLTNITR